jgi:prepilin-type N-terminal cleavage/methylation domain-containing protein/prepilin-type processing-associated H-X9-DG protein
MVASHDMDTRRRGFTVIEVLVVIGIIAVLMAILIPMIERVRHRAYIAECGNNLRQIGAGLLNYSIANHESLPRTVYVAGAPPTHGTGAAAVDPFQPGGPQPNDVTAAVFLLMRSQRIPPFCFICPYNDVYSFDPEPADPQTGSNFTDYHKNLGYSFANPYPSAEVAAAGYKWTALRSAEFALAADLNPGVLGYQSDVLAVTPTSPRKVMKKALSANHEHDGQNVLFGDGHVAWTQTPFVGAQQDNIYTTQNGQIDGSPASKNDSVLLPTDD